MNLWHTLAALSLVLLLTAELGAQFGDKKTLTLAAAKKAAEAAEMEAKKNNWAVVIAIVDDGGHLVYLSRLDGAPIGVIEVALGKARSAAYYKRPSKAFQDELVGGRAAILNLAGASPFEGGEPIMAGNQVVGAIGVSGVTGEQDGQIARAGIAALAK